MSPKKCRCCKNMGYVKENNQPVCWDGRNFNFDTYSYDDKAERCGEYQECPAPDYNPDQFTEPAEPAGAPL